ncbi:MAG: CocE/NonD family hydrolase [Saprospiraceae bacterium]|nr:CocE/NonD family hydrolase [Saprospiraceae bacterium]
MDSVAFIFQTKDYIEIKSLTVMRLVASSSILICLALNLWGQHDQNIDRSEARIPMRDGIELAAIVYAPEQEKTFPALLYRTPYGIENYDSWAELPVLAAKRGYLVILVDVRGRYSSEGEFEAYRNEKEDGHDVIEWVASHPRCNGRVGTYGGSYPGIVQWLAMTQSPNGLWAAAPEMTPIGSHHFFYNGGAFSTTWLDWFVPLIFPDKMKRAGKEEIFVEMEKNFLTDRKKWYGFRPMNEHPFLKEFAPEYFEWLEHPERDSWWDFVNIEDHFKKFQAPVFLLSGWYDAAYGVEGAIRAFEKMQTESAGDRASNHTKLILGPWNHTTVEPRKTEFGEIDFGPSAGMNYDELLLDWFDAQIKNGQESELPRASIFMMGANHWLAYETWPPPNAKPVEYFLMNDHMLSNEPGSSEGLTYRFDPADPLWDKSYEKSYPYDQRENESRSDVLTFTSEPLIEDLDIVGEVVAELFVSSTAADTDFSITLCDVYPDGRSINLAGLDAGYLRMRYRESYDRQVLMEPGEVYKIRIGRLFTANCFKKGHSIRLAITSSKAPHYDPNPNTGRKISSETRLIPCENTIHVGVGYPSRLVLPVIDP